MAGGLEDQALQRKARLKALRAKKAGQESTEVRCARRGTKIGQ